jgi:hypothetical protein
MPIKKPSRVFVEFEDGSMCEAPFESLPETLQSDIMRQPFASKPAPEPEKEKCLILEWDDGWKEVIRVDDTCTEMNRYYVISRVEHVGRLSIHKQNGYPELIEIVRKPLNLNRITFADDFQVALQRSDREGDKTDHFFTLTKEEGARRKRIDEFKAIIEQQAIDLEVLRSQEPHTQLEQYEKIRKALSIKAGLRQQDVYDYIAFLINTGFKISVSPR